MTDAEMADGAGTGRTPGEGDGSGPAISDARVAATLLRFATLANRLLADPPGWLEEDDAADLPGEHGAREGGRLGRLRSVADRVRDRVAGDVHPGDPGWATLSSEARAEWWVDRVRALAAPVAAAPRVAGLAADRLPVQAALGAAAQGLAVCAVAREHGVEDPREWVPLLGRILLDRDLRPVMRSESALGTHLPAQRETDRADVDEAEVDEADVDEGDVDGSERGGALRRGAGRLWYLARLLLELYGLFDERPRGALPFRALGKVPVVGLLGGVLDERGGVRRAAQQARRLVEEGWTRG